MRLIDKILRQGHLSEDALVEALMTGKRPVHLDRCDLCAERALALGRWLDEVRADANEAADSVFTTERLAAQRSRIMRRIEQLDHPARVIAFPALSHREREATGEHRVAVSWVGVAAAAGLVLGLLGGQLSARLGQRTPAPPPVTQAAAPLPTVDGPAGPVDTSWLGRSYDSLHISSFEAMDDLTPRLTQVSARTAR